MSRETLASHNPERLEGGPASVSVPPPLASSSTPTPTSPGSPPGGGLRFRPRAPHEWQGMLIRDREPAPCGAPDSCGLGLACKSGKCVACEADADCARGESCVLDHCLATRLVGCRHRSDCAADSWCILSGYSATLRGNDGMRSFCVSDNSGTEHLAHDSEPPPPPDTRRELPYDDLLRRSQTALKAETTKP